MTADTRLWHGGVPGLKIGDTLTGGHERKTLDGCPMCEARKKGAALLGIDPPSAHPNKVYVTHEREYARFHASLYGRGDLYVIEPVGDTMPSTEDSIPTLLADEARIVGVYSRAVLLTPGQRRRLMRIWGHHDGVAALNKIKASHEANTEENEMKASIELVDQNGEQFWTDPKGRILRHDPEGETR